MLLGMALWGHFAAAGTGVFAAGLGFLPLLFHPKPDDGNGVKGDATNVSTLAVGAVQPRRISGKAETKTVWDRMAALMDELIEAAGPLVDYIHSASTNHRNYYIPLGHIFIQPAVTMKR